MIIVILEWWGGATSFAKMKVLHSCLWELVSQVSALITGAKVGKEDGGQR